MLGHLLLDDGLDCPDAPRLAYVWMLRQAVVRAHRIGAQADFRRTQTLAAGRGLGLQPVQEAQAHALRVLQLPRGDFG
jgi:hypothetical protein